MQRCSRPHGFWWPWPTAGDSSGAEMPAAMSGRIAEIGGYEVNLVMEKRLQDTDVNKNHGRLLLPRKKLMIDFASEEERRMLNEEEAEKKKKGIEATIMDGALRERSIRVKKWKIGSEESYCLMTNWNSVVKETALKSGDSIQLWSFRRNCFDFETQSIRARLCFGLVNLRHQCS